ncbi:unnamed protein product, partial [Symbiodinium sp. CCMP2456]
WFLPMRMRFGFRSRIHPRRRRLRCRRFLRRWEKLTLRSLPQPSRPLPGGPRDHSQ